MQKQWIGFVFLGSFLFAEKQCYGKGVWFTNRKKIWGPLIHTKTSPQKIFRLRRADIRSPQKLGGRPPPLGKNNTVCFGGYFFHFHFSLFYFHFFAHFVFHFLLVLIIFYFFFSFFPIFSVLISSFCQFLPFIFSDKITTQKNKRKLEKKLKWQSVTMVKKIFFEMKKCTTGRSKNLGAESGGRDFRYFTVSY